VRPALDIDLKGGAIRTVIWATGYRPDYSWLRIPVLDRRGWIRHDGGVAASPGLYVLGLPFLRRRKSSFIHGAGDDARELSGHLAVYLDELSRRHLARRAG
jgi:putative flavoprotein involved in K+ transport